MIASERRLVTEGESRLSLAKRLEQSGRPIKVYVIDPKQFQSRLDLDKLESLNDFKKNENQGHNQFELITNGGNIVNIKEQQSFIPPPKKPVHIPIAPKESMRPGTTIILPPTTTLLPLPMIPVSLSLPIVSVGGCTMVPGPSPTRNKEEQVKIKKKVKKKKRKLTFDKNRVNEHQDPEEMKFLLKESVTRTGRLSKSTMNMNNVVQAAINGSLGASSNPSSPGNQAGAGAGSGGGSVHIPIPSPSSGSGGLTEWCNGGQRVVPEPSGQGVKKREPPEKFKCLTCARFYLGNAKFNQHFQRFPDHVKACPNGIKDTPTKKPKVKKQRERTSLTNDGKGRTKTKPRPKASDQDEDSLEISGFAPKSKKASTVNPDTLSDNCRTSPKLPVFSPTNDIFTIPSELIGPGSCSQQSFNSLENLLGGDSNQRPGTPTSVVSGVVSISNCSGNERNNSTATFFSSATPTSSCSVPVPSILPIPVVTIDEESRDTDINNSGEEEGRNENNKRNHTPSGDTPIPNVPKRRSIWEFVKEQIRFCGINQTCGEISEMAEKLSKIARDKFYPIQEDEVERRGSSSPFIHVDTPFISHLLDLPFGTYTFKEDGGIRKILPPPTPVSTELSLTNGVEVDVDKFLSPDMDLVSLPHLTNLDFNSICN